MTSKFKQFSTSFQVFPKALVMKYHKKVCLRQQTSVESQDNDASTQRRKNETTHAPQAEE